MSFEMTMRFNDTDIARIIAACKVYQDQTGSEWMWDQYDVLIEKLKTYKEQYSTD